ncbi:MAG: DUF4382 domain-containing protein [Acidobacteriota bacterium]
MKKIFYILIMTMAMVFFFQNCNSGTELMSEKIPGLEGINNSDQNNTGSGILKFFIKSGKRSGSSSLAGIAGTKEDITSLIVTIVDLEVHRTSDSDASWHSLPVEDGEFDLIAMDANGWSEVFSNAAVTAGSYNKIRFEVSGAIVTTESGTYDVSIPSGVIKIGIPFVVNDDGTTEITIEIDPEASLKIVGNKNDPKYKMSPVIHVSSVDEEDGDDDDDDDDDDED